MLGEGEMQPASDPEPAFAGVRVRRVDTGEWLPTNYVPRGGNRYR